jgi:hypothetical protein
VFPWAARGAFRAAELMTVVGFGRPVDELKLGHFEARL